MTMLPLIELEPPLPSTAEGKMRVLRDTLKNVAFPGADEEVAQIVKLAGEALAASQIRDLLLARKYTWGVAWPERRMDSVKGH